MFQKFYSDTLGGRYIKSLLAQTPIPMYESVVDGDHIIAGCYYVYKRFIIHCVSSGVLAVSKSEKLHPSGTLYPSIFLFPATGYRGATFYVRSYVDDYNIKTHSVFKSSTNYYDSETHYHLGRYLRYLYTTTGLNLFSYYNCYNSTYFSDVELSVDNKRRVVINRVNNSSNKVVGIPILFGRTYSIFIDSPTQVLMRACIHDDSGFVDEDTMYSTAAQDIYSVSLRETLQESGKIYPNLMFNKPVKFRVETSSTSAVMLQHNLYLVIQLPPNNDSSIVVLENYENRTGVRCNDKHVREFSSNNLSLLKMNTRTSYAFSDRLIEYLLGNIVYTNDLISRNVSTVQTLLSNIFSDYKLSFIRGEHKKGVWDSDISSFVQKLIDTQEKNYMLYDQDGNINKDIELLLYSRGGKHL